MSEMQPLHEHPRPDFVRRDWVNLNGWWSFAFDAYGAGESSGWFNGLPDDSGRILVPYVHQCPLSCIDDPAQVDFVWYARTFRIPDSWHGRRILLHFGAVDYHADVWVNGSYAGSHWGYGGRPRTEEELLVRYRETIQAFLGCPSLSGFVYTQLTDVEQETNGLFTIQRRLKFSLETLRNINQSPSARG